jgi:alpha-N-arabinofuranosidase
VFLKISADELHYSLHFSEDGKKWILMGSNYARLLSSETAGTFTGTYLGMFATGNGGPSKLPAKFDFFEYRKLNR